GTGGFVTTAGDRAGPMAGQVRQRHFQELFERAVTARGAVGGTLTVAHGDGVAECAVGITSTTSRIQVDNRTLFRGESHTKIFTPTPVLQLRDMGLLSLDDRVVDHLTDLPDRCTIGDVTIRHLLGHQSGLPDLPVETYESWDRPIREAAQSVAT